MYCPYAAGFHTNGCYTYEHSNLLTLAWLLNGSEISDLFISTNPLALLDWYCCFRSRELSSPSSPHLGYGSSASGVLLGFLGLRCANDLLIASLLLLLWQDAVCIPSSGVGLRCQISLSCCLLSESPARPAIRLRRCDVYYPFSFGVALLLSSRHERSRYSFYSVSV